MNQPLEYGAVTGSSERYARSLAMGLFTLALGVLVGPGTPGARSGEQDHQGKDPRKEIALTADQRETVLRDMRGMLTAMQGILNGAQEMNVQRMRAAAQSAGSGATLVPRDAGLQQALPLDFRDRAADAHALFDMLANAIRGFTARDTALVYLSRISQECVACHALYRLTTKE